jgi:hypothetical protein
MSNEPTHDELLNGPRVRGWPMTPDRKEPYVYLGFDFGAYNFDTTMSPAAARRLAARLLWEADKVEAPPCQPH